MELDKLSDQVNVAPHSERPTLRGPSTHSRLMAAAAEDAFPAEMIPPRPSWMVDAACLGLTSLFYPSTGASTTEAKETCAGCPVRQECFDYVLGEESDRNIRWTQFGVWAGTSERQRRRLRAERRRKAS